MTDLSSLHRIAQPHPVRAPRGSQLHCKNWLIEAAAELVRNGTLLHAAQKLLGELE